MPAPESAVATSACLWALRRDFDSLSRACDGPIDCLSHRWSTATRTNRRSVEIDRDLDMVRALAGRITVALKPELGAEHRRGRICDDSPAPSHAHTPSGRRERSRARRSSARAARDPRVNSLLDRRAATPPAPRVHPAGAVCHSSRSSAGTPPPITPAASPAVCTSRFVIRMSAPLEALLMLSHDMRDWECHTTRRACDQGPHRAERCRTRADGALIDCCRVVDPLVDIWLAIRN